MKRRYVPDLKEFSQLASMNFLRLYKLLAGFEPDYERRLRLPATAQHKDVLLYLVVRERFRYTATVELQANYPSDYLESQQFIVRCYLDAREAEVMACAHGRSLEGVYQYPNDKGFSVDEKYQQNRSLSEWLLWASDDGVADWNVNQDSLS